MKPTWHGEVQLAGWSESHNGGCKVTFWLAESSDLDAFKVMTARKGNTAGQRLACALVEIGDDEQPVQGPAPEQQPAPEQPKGGPLARLAGQWCQMPHFHAWIRQELRHELELARERSVVELGDIEAAAAVIREECGVRSRAELDHNEQAAERFHRIFREPFMAWQDGR